MQRIIRKWMETDFADFSGASVTGSIPIPAEVINEVLADVLRSVREEVPSASDPEEAVATGGGDNAAPPPAVAGGSLPSGIEPRQFLKWLTRAEVRAADGKVTLDFEIHR